MIDKELPRFNQAMVALVIGTAWIGGWRWLIGALFGVMALTRFAGPRAGLFNLLYEHIVRPRRATSVELEPASPHRFSQLLAVLFLGAASLAFSAGIDVAGWVIAITVFGLATLAAVGRICVGCMVYQQVTSR